MEDQRFTIIEHLAELRSRLVRSAVYVAVGTAICWLGYGYIDSFLLGPTKHVLKQFGGELAYYNLADAFMVKMQVSIICGVMVAVIPLMMSSNDATTAFDRRCRSVSSLASSFAAATEFLGDRAQAFRDEVELVEMIGTKLRSAIEMARVRR